jgi:hypothetical protein
MSILVNIEAVKEAKKNREWRHKYSSFRIFWMPGFIYRN